MAVLREGEVVIPIHRPAWREKSFFFLSGMISSIPLTLFVSQFADSVLGSLSSFYAVLFSSVLFAPFWRSLRRLFPCFIGMVRLRDQFLSWVFWLGWASGSLSLLSMCLCLVFRLFSGWLGFCFMGRARRLQRMV